MNNVRHLAVTVIGIVLLLLGLVLAAGGVYLVVLGGSWFYLFAGLIMGACGFGVFQRKRWALFGAWALLAISLIWAFSEVGTDFWQLVPRTITFIVVTLLVTLCAPTLLNAENKPVLSCKKSGLLSLALVASLVAIFTSMFSVHPEVEASGEKLPVLNDSAAESSGNDWAAFGRNSSGQRFAQFTQINTQNVKDLKVAWTYHTGDLAINGAEYQVTPLKVGNTMYLCTPLNKVIALDPVSGKEKWRFDPKIEETSGNKNWKRCRGVAYTELSPAEQNKNPRIISTTVDGRLFSLDAETGKLDENFGDRGFINLLAGLGATAHGSYYLTSAPLAADGVVMVGGKLNDNLTTGEASGVVRGFDASTGKLLWAWDASRGAKDSTPLPEGEIYPIETPNFWGTAAYDAKTGVAYFPTGNQTPDFWTGNRHPYSDEYNDAIVAVELKTGKELWHFRTANQDQFDYDVSSQPILYDMPAKDGSVTPVLIQLTKRGQIFVLDRRTGKPVIPVEYRPVSTDAMPGMKVSPTQPYSAISVGATALKESDMWGASIFDQLYCRIQFKDMRWEGEFTPLSDKKRTLIYPGYYGGFNWGGGAIDVATGTLIVNDIRMAQWGKFIKREDAARIGMKPSTEGEYSEQLGTPWGVERSMFMSPLGVPCFKPPFGSMTAIDLATGKTRWQVPMGTIKDAPIHGVAPGLDIPLGMPTMGGPLVTKGGLTFFHGTLDYYLRALDNNTGKELWRGRLPVGGQGAPMTYIGEDGKQYVVVVAGGATRTGTNDNRGDDVIAYALP
ncbi:membrane-bound PQQ-dependent dehydrogenase, glucose/quinate/shikimate family [Candidatus Pantoea multigeneris]|uniref:Membrane-bound PQQ-dependent dehydrogenase, glucose/quinate/shikimate family n=1 Tax=Candidatus Pantoea multigeneris TaxID=2608357 RepID=A0ABX0RBJ8_9GAMM|nr:membrane-bound PQQ-dependent dehydrogenase, glucose/quinate/shikimate family [Pantoea multigeneris]NIF21483.1 membrane-bound PQQ-dependent dehydrogenase, glucose/quinate/shikimate family [Pantoea multigeneris]